MLDPRQLEVRLFCNDYTPTILIARTNDFIESWGYHREDLGKKVELKFVEDPEEREIYGYFVVDKSSGEAVIVERFDQAPLRMPMQGGSIRIVLNYLWERDWIQDI